MSTAPLKVAFVVKDRYSNQITRDLLIRFKNDSLIELSHLIVVKRSPRISALEFLSSICLQLILATEWLFLLRSRRIVSRILNRCEISSLFMRSLEVNAEDIKSGSLQKLSEVSVDLIVNLGDKVEGLGHFSKLSRLGVLDAEYTPQGVNSSFLAGFWEVFHKLDNSVFRISRVHENGHQEGLLECLFQTRYCFLLNKSFLLKKSSVHFYNFVLEIAKSGQLPSSTVSQDTSHVKMKPMRLTLIVVAFYILKTLKIVLSKIFRILFFNGYQWHVVIYNEAIKGRPTEKPRVIPNPPKRFLADPFLVEHEAKTFCFVEDFESKSKKGRISCLEIHENTVTDVKVCLEEPFHLSFPYVFKFNNEFYMCPETCESNQIRVYKAINFPYDWKLEKVIMENVRAADTLLFEMHGRWWMLTNIDPSRVGDNSSELYLYSAESPLSTNWVAHPSNPIYVDSCKARNGGILVDQVTIYRVAQMQTFDTYGASIRINRIDEIGRDVYKETLVASISPDYLPNILGTHHISGTAKFSALDFYNLTK